jgi:hypothetical protein
MQTIVNHKHFNCATQMGFQPSSNWSAVEISYDRTPEQSRVQEGAGYA